MIAVIPINTGSTRLPGKNFKPLCRLPLVEWSLMLARCFYDRGNIWCVVRGALDRNDEELLRHYSDHVVSEPALGEETSALNAVLTVPLEARSYGALLLQPTYVPRTRRQVEWFIRAAAAEGNTRTVTPEDGQPNGNLYYINDASKGYELDLRDHGVGVDINTLEDFQRAETLMAQRLATAFV